MPDHQRKVEPPAEQRACLFPTSYTVSGGTSPIESDGFLPITEDMVPENVLIFHQQWENFQERRLAQ